MTTQTAHQLAVVAVGSAHQSAAAQAVALRQHLGPHHPPVIAVTAGSAGFLTALATPMDRWQISEVADVYGRPTCVRWLIRAGMTALIDATELITAHPAGADANLRDVSTSYGIGQLVAAASRRGVTRVIIGASGFPGADVASGAANAAGARLRKADGSGLKVGVNELAGFARYDPAPRAGMPQVTLLCDVNMPFRDIVGVDDVRQRFAAAIAEQHPEMTTDMPMSGAFDGLAYGMASMLRAELVPAVAYGVALHDPDRHQRHGQILVGSADQLAVFATEYAGATVTHVTEHVSPADAAVVRSAYTSLA